MGVIRAQPARVTDWAAKSVGAAWRAFDLQLTTYAVLLVAVGLVMAYTNSVEDGAVPLEAGTTFSRGLMWAAIASVVFVVATAFDYHWLKTLAWPIYGVQLGLLVLTLLDRRRRRRLGAMGRDRAAHLPVQRDRQDPDDRRARELPDVAQPALGLARLDPRRLRARRPAARARHAPARPRDVARVRRDPRRHALDVRVRACAGWPSSRAGVVAMVPIAWTYILRDYQKERLSSFIDTNPDIQGAGLPALPGADRGRIGRRRLARA